MSDKPPPPAKPIIVPLPDGPYYLISDPGSQPAVENLYDHRGEQLRAIRGVSLCRCGQSKNKPFCDGTHSVVGFESNNNNNNDSQSSGSPPDRRKNYAGREVTVHDNRAICSHSAECIRNLPAAFRLGERPWVAPDGASAEKVIETVRRCPSGALSYSVDGVEYRDQDREPRVTVARNGPYHVTGGIELAGAKWAEGASKEHYVLCRCGASANKPFCDGTHLQIGFRDNDDGGGSS